MADWKKGRGRWKTEWGDATSILSVESTHTHLHMHARTTTQAHAHIHIRVHPHTHAQAGATPQEDTPSQANPYRAHLAVDERQVLSPRQHDGRLVEDAIAQPQEVVLQPPVQLNHVFRRERDVVDSGKGQ